jgi:hypothetical protein
MRITKYSDDPCRSGGLRLSATGRLARIKDVPLAPESPTSPRARDVGATARYAHEGGWYLCRQCWAIFTYLLGHKKRFNRKRK